MKRATITFEVEVQDRDEELLQIVGDTLRARFYGTAVRVLSVDTSYESEPRYYVIHKNDVGKRAIQAFGRIWPVQDFMGHIMLKDVGKRVYRVTGDDGVIDYLQVENDEQFSFRRDGA